MTHGLRCPLEHSMRAPPTLSSRPAAARDTHSGREDPLARAGAGDGPRHPRRPLRARLRLAIWPAAEVVGPRGGGGNRNTIKPWTCAQTRDARRARVGSRGAQAYRRGWAGRPGRGARAPWLQRTICAFSAASAPGAASAENNLRVHRARQNAGGERYERESRIWSRQGRGGRAVAGALACGSRDLFAPPCWAVRARREGMV